MSPPKDPRAESQDGVTQEAFDEKVRADAARDFEARLAKAERFLVRLHERDANREEAQATILKKLDAIGEKLSDMDRTQEQRLNAVERAQEQRINAVEAAANAKFLEQAEKQRTSPLKIAAFLAPIIISLAAAIFVAGSMPSRDDFEKHKITSDKKHAASLEEHRKLSERLFELQAKDAQLQGVIDRIADRLKVDERLLRIEETLRSSRR